MLSVPLAVHEEFKARRPSYIRFALGATLLFHASLLVLSPPPELRPYKAPDPKNVVTLHDVEHYDYLPREPDEVKGPDISPEPAPDPNPPLPPPPEMDPESGVLKALTPRTPTTDRPFVVVDELPKLLNPIRPAYPSLAREAGIEGTVRLKVVVGADGKVLDVRVLSSDVTPSMEKAAVAAAKRCRFQPGRQGSNAVKATVVIPFHFRLH